MAKPDNKAAPAATGEGFKFKIKRRVVVPILKLLAGTPVFVRIESAIESRKKVEKDDKGVEKESTIDICRVTNMETGEMGEFVVGNVLRDDLTEAYPDAKYVGLSFRILKKDVPGKRYKTYELDEIEAG
jgi:hypothetical protein